MVIWYSVRAGGVQVRRVHVLRAAGGRRLCDVLQPSRQRRELRYGGLRGAPRHVQRPLPRRAGARALRHARRAPAHHPVQALSCSLLPPPSRHACLDLIVKDVNL